MSPQGVDILSGSSFDSMCYECGSCSDTGLTMPGKAAAVSAMSDAAPRDKPNPNVRKAAARYWAAQKVHKAVETIEHAATKAAKAHEAVKA